MAGISPLVTPVKGPGPPPRSSPSPLLRTPGKFRGKTDEEIVQMSEEDQVEIFIKHFFFLNKIKYLKQVVPVPVKSPIQEAYDALINLVTIFFFNLYFHIYCIGNMDMYTTMKQSSSSL
jgi:hypothetical protein